MIEKENRKRKNDEKYENDEMMKRMKINIMVINGMVVVTGDVELFGLCAVILYVFFHIHPCTYIYIFQFETRFIFIIHLV